MKKVFALLLAFLCLMAVPGVGESRSVTVAFEADQEEMTAFGTALGLPDGELLAKGIAKLLNSATLEYCTAEAETGEQTAKLDFRLGEETVLDITVYMPGDKSCLMIASSMFPGYAVRFTDELGELESFSLDMRQADPAALKELLSGPVTEKTRQWLDSLNSVTTYGDFMGDAYDGGRVCVDLTLEDSDLYVLCMHLEPELRRAFELMGLPGEEKSLQKGMLKAALENANQYRVRMVYDGAHSLTGISVTALNSGTQVATLSLGYETPGMTRFVLGTGVQDKVYYLDGELRTEDRTELTARVYADPKKAGFPGAKTEEKNLLQTLTMEISTAGTEEAWTAAYSGSLQDREGQKIREEGTFSTADKQYAWEDSIFLGDRERPVMTVRIRSGASDSMPAWPEDLQVVDDPDDERVTAAMQEATASLSAALIRLIPTELWLYIMQFNTIMDK